MENHGKRETEQNRAKLETEKQKEVNRNTTEWNSGDNEGNLGERDSHHSGSIPKGSDEKWNPDDWREDWNQSPHSGKKNRGRGKKAAIAAVLAVIFVAAVGGAYFLGTRKAETSSSDEGTAAEAKQTDETEEASVSAPTETPVPVMTATPTPRPRALVTGKCGSTAEFQLSGSKTEGYQLIIFGSGEIDWFYSLFYEYSENITTVVIENGITKIGDFFFSSYDNLETVILSSGITRIGKYAFSGCENLKSINMPDGLQQIGENAFSNTGITEFLCPSTVTEIGKSAFQYCKQLEKISLPEGLSSIGEDAFASTAIQELYLPSTLNTVSDSSFAFCRDLKKIYFSEGICVIESYAFQGTTSLEKVHFPTTLQSIGDCAFNARQRKKEVEYELPEGVSLGDNIWK